MFALEDLYRAYRKAKHEAFSDATQPTLLAFADYEIALHANLLKLQKVLRDKRRPWFLRKKIISGHAYLPKALDAVSTAPQAGHFSSGDQTKDWARQFGIEKEKARAEFRLVIVPTIELQVISALWVLHVGRTYDLALDDDLAYGSRPRKAVVRTVDGVSIEDDSYALFAPYFSGYRRWRENGLAAMERALEDGESVVALTMDARRYYHSISPRFLLSPTFLARNGISLSAEQREFTRRMVLALEGWFASTPDYDGTPYGAVPVGLSASKVIANVLLAEFDRVVVDRLDCKYYGRYVDDIFMVVGGAGFEDASAVVEWLRQELDGYVVLERQGGTTSGLRLTMPYLDKARVVFSGSKQKVFLLEGQCGKDLLDQVREQVRKASSEYRLMPSLREVESVLSGALLANSDAAIEADSLRKAEAMTVRRHGLSIAVRNLDSYAKDIDSAEWKEKRQAAYGLILRHVITPVGVFNYSKYIIKVFGIVISCEDWKSAVQFIDRVGVVLALVRDGTDESVHESGLASVVSFYQRSFLEAALAASTVAGFSFSAEFRRILARLDVGNQLFGPGGVSAIKVKRLSTRILLADLGRRPYKDYWYNENPSTAAAPAPPEVHFILQMVATFKGIKQHLLRTLNDPYWPAIAFATRPLSLQDISLTMPSLMEEPSGVEKALLTFRGASVPPWNRGVTLVRKVLPHLECVVPWAATSPVKVAVPSYRTTDDQWMAALGGAPDVSLERYEALISLVNSIVQGAPDVDYIALPECSVPFSWAISIARNLAHRGISFICGLEASPKGGAYRNDALVSLATNLGGYRSSLIFRQPKLELAHREAEHVSNAGLNFNSPKPPYGRPVYIHGDFIFAVLLCSDLTNIDNRRALQGEVDGVFVLEWNPDVDTFSFLVESAAHDLHAMVVQINNRTYGDSRVRVPFRQDYARDVVRVKGGVADFFAMASFDFMSIRRYQSDPHTSGGLFKPLPIGFKIADRRRLS